MFEVQVYSQNRDVKDAIGRKQVIGFWILKNGTKTNQTLASAVVTDLHRTDVNIQHSTKHRLHCGSEPLVNCKMLYIIIIHIFDSDDP